MLVIPAEFALLRGVSRATVCAAMKDRIQAAIVIKDGKRWLDQDIAMELWNRNTKRNNNAVVDAPLPTKSALPSTAPIKRQPSDPAAAALVDAVMAQADDEIPDRYDSEARKIHYQAELAKLQTMKERGDLVATTEIKARWFEHGRAIRDNLMSIPDRIASQLAACTDAREAHTLLSNEINGALRVLADG